MRAPRAWLCRPNPSRFRGAKCRPRSGAPPAHLLAWRPRPNTNSLSLTQVMENPLNAISPNTARPLFRQLQGVVFLFAEGIHLCFKTLPSQWCSLPDFDTNKSLTPPIHGYIFLLVKGNRNCSNFCFYSILRRKICICRARAVQPDFGGSNTHRTGGMQVLRGSHCTGHDPAPSPIQATQPSQEVTFVAGSKFASVFRADRRQEPPVLLELALGKAGLVLFG